jgi:hypothetical protein
MRTYNRLEAPLEPLDTTDRPVDLGVDELRSAVHNCLIAYWAFQEAADAHHKAETELRSEEIQRNFASFEELNEYIIHTLARRDNVEGLRRAMNKALEEVGRRKRGLLAILPRWIDSIRFDFDGDPQRVVIRRRDNAPTSIDFQRGDRTGDGDVVYSGGEKI